MNQLQKIFNYDGRQIRTVLIDGEPHFVAKDVCDVLELSNSRMAIDRLNSKMKGVSIIDTLGGPQEMAIVNEAGVYKLVFTSRKPEAEKFTDWIAEEVLPTIRQTGSYSMKLPQSFAEALRLAADQAEQIEAQRIQLAATQPKVEFYDAVAGSKDAIEIAEAAKVLAIPNVGRNKLFQLLREKKILMPNNQHYQEFIDRGYFRVIEQKFTKSNGDTCINIKTLIYQRGLDYIRQLLTKKAG